MNRNCNYLFITNSFIVHWVFLSLSLSVLVSCQSKDQPENNKPTKNTKAVNMCDLISQQDAEKIFNVTVENVKNTVRNSSAKGESFATQCTYQVKSSAYKTIAIMVNYSVKMTNPKTINELVALNTPKIDAKNEAQQKILDDVKNSFITGTQIKDMGDIGVWYNWAEVPSLMLYFKEHYQLIINLTGFEYNNDTLGMVKIVAEKLIKTFN